MPRKILLLLLLATTLVNGQQRDESEVVSVASEDADMAGAIRTARDGLDEFLKLAASPPPDTSDYKLKVAVRDGEEVEHFWVIPFQQTDDGFTGTLANDPKLVRNVEVGQSIRFKRSDISDWGYVRHGRQVGSYTVCVLFKQMPAEQATYYRTNHGFDC